jgi:hypothetical protein
MRFFQFVAAQIRKAAEELAGLMELLKITPFLDDMSLDCRNAVRGIKR